MNPSENYYLGILTKQWRWTLHASGILRGRYAGNRGYCSHQAVSHPPRSQVGQALLTHLPVCEIPLVGGPGTWYIHVPPWPTRPPPSSPTYQPQLGGRWRRNDPSRLLSCKKPDWAAIRLWQCYPPRHQLPRQRTASHCHQTTGHHTPRFTPASTLLLHTAHPSS